MILKHLSKRHFVSTGDIPTFPDHCLFLMKSQSPVDFPGYFTAFSMVAMLKGWGKFNINGSRVTLDENSFLVVNRGSTLSFTLGKSGGYVVILCFNTTLADLVARKIFFRKESTGFPASAPGDFSLVEHVHYENASLKQHLPALIALENSCASFHALKADMIVRSILEYIIHENYSAIQVSSKLKVVKTSTRIDLYKRLAITKNWMDSNHADPIKLDHLADISMLNAEHFLRLFKQAYGKTPYQYLKSVRLSHAKELLRTTDLPVSAVCHEVGFESISSFSILFKQCTGQSPTRFREKI